jgi:2-polyprenyl-6-methoxyphenol hydroxylase-like FAD-dependent oxidoreductase
MERENITGVAKTLIVGGGIGGMAAAIALAERGVAVDLIDLDPQWRVYGAGITITGPTLRAYRRIGLLDQIKAQGAITSKTRLFRFDGHPSQGSRRAGNRGRPARNRRDHAADPAPHHAAQSYRTGHPGPAGPDRVRAGEPRRWGRRAFSNGTEGRYDLVVGADSVASGVRSIAFPHMGPAQPTGQGCWRISIAKPPGLNASEFFLGHANPAGITPCAPDKIYLWMLTPHVEREQHMDEEELFVTLKALLRDFGGNAGGSATR